MYYNKICIIPVVDGDNDATTGCINSTHVPLESTGTRRASGGAICWVLDADTFYTIFHTHM